jgi:hypothetical protein
MVMAIRIFPLMAYLSSMAYLISLVIRLVQAIYQSIKRWVYPTKFRLSIKNWSKASEETGIYVYLIGMMFGGLATLWLVNIFIREWLLVILVVLAILRGELRITSTETLLLEVMVFFEYLVAHIESHHDLFEALPNVIQEMPQGRVQKGVLEAVFRRRSRESFENSLEAMRGIDPLLDEFVLSLVHTGWKAGPGLHIILNRLISRAGRKWDSASRRLFIKYKIRTYLQFSQSALVTGLWVILISGLPALNRVMPDRAVIVLAILALLGLGYIFFLFLTRQWLRRFGAASISIIALVVYACSLTAPIPSWIQIETISHQSDSFNNTSITPEISNLNQVFPASFQSATPNKPPISGSSDPASIPNLAIVEPFILNPPILISTPAITQDLNLCCLQSPQPR